MSRNRTHKTNAPAVTQNPSATGASSASTIMSDSGCRTLSVVINTYSESGGETLGEWHVCGGAETIREELTAELAGVAARFAERYAAKLRAACPTK